MTPAETPRERARRLWEGVGYAAAAADGAPLSAAWAPADPYDAADVTAYAAGVARYRREHPSVSEQECEACLAGLEYATEGQLLGIIEQHHAILRAERERADRLAAEKELLIGQLLLGSQWTRQRWLEWLEGRFVATAALKEAKE